MKFTNVKQLIIKFMGGGLINFPTRFLRWVKINGDVDGDDSGDGGGSSSDVFFSPLVIQPTHYIEFIPTDEEDETVIKEIQDISGTIEPTNWDDTYKMLCYSKNELVSIGIEENALNNLQQLTLQEVFDDAEGVAGQGLKPMNIRNILSNNYIIEDISLHHNTIDMHRALINNNTGYAIYRIGTDIYIFVQIAIVG